MTPVDPTPVALTRAIPIIEAALTQALPDAGDLPQLGPAMAYALSGGKRWRGALALASLAACGGDQEEGAYVAAAVEMIHAATLVHDDLPSMDDDAERRGRPSTHIRFGEAHAILVGDALIVGSFEALARGAQDPLLVGPLIQDLARAVGAGGALGGQILDLTWTGQAPSREIVEDIHRRKTGALVAAACVMGARVAGAREAVRRDFQRFGEELGVAFQIQDDLLDHDDDHRGASGTARRFRPSWPQVGGLAEAEAEGVRRVAAAVKVIQAYDTNGELAELARFAVGRRR